MPDPITELLRPFPSALPKPPLAGTWASLAPLRAHPAWARLDALKVVGSNGKGSVTAMLDALLRACGRRTGRFTSPHLLRWTERVHVAGAPVGEVELAEAISWLTNKHLASAQAGLPVLRFAALQAAALRIFFERGVDAFILEAGIGGRLDPTRAVPGRTVGLTSVDLEHVALLGGTRLLIALDKAGACPDGGELICGAIGEDLRTELAAWCAMREVELIPAEGLCRLTRAQAGPSGSTLDLELAGHPVGGVRLGLPGGHQIENAQVAIAMAWRWLRRRGEPERLLEVLPSALTELRHPGRCTWLPGTPPTLLDVAHTPDATRWLARFAAETLPAPRALVLGASVGRDPEALLGPMLELGAAVFAYTPRHRGGPVEPLLALARARGLPAHALDRAEEALAAARRWAGAHGGAVLMAGSLFGVAEALASVEGIDPATLPIY